MRRATSEDVPTLVDLMTAFYAESGYQLDRERAEKAFVMLLTDQRLGQAWLVDRDGEAVGYLVVTFVFGMEYGGLMAFIDDFFVRAEARGAGLGSAALGLVREECARLDVRALWVQVDGEGVAAKGVYHRAGFEPVATRLMVLPLADPAHVEQGRPPRPGG